MIFHSTRKSFFASCILWIFLAGIIPRGMAGETASEVVSTVLGPRLRSQLSRIPGPQSGLRTLSDTRPLLPVLIKADEAATEGITRWIQDNGGTVMSVAGTVVAAEISADQVPVLGRLAGIRYVSRAGRARPLLTVSVPEMRADQVHNPQPAQLPRDYQGTGVIVGFIDSGIDYTHLDFINANGTSRLLSLWDQTSGVGDPPSGQTFGTEYTQTQLNTAIQGQGGVYQTFSDSHGTHVAACGVSNGREDGGFTGAAPGADVVFVKTDFDIPDVIAGVDYIVSKAAESGKPCVVNLSLGTHEGPHDGTDSFAEAINSYAGPGRIIVAAAGNEAEETIHLGYTVNATGRSTRMTFTPGSNEVYVDMWYEAPDSIDFMVEAYTYTNQVVGSTGWVAPGNAEDTVPLQNGSVIYGAMDLDATETVNPNNGARHVVLSVYRYSGKANFGSSSLYFKVWARGTGSFDAWNEYGEFGTSDDGAAYAGNGEKTVGLPAVAPDVIAVGNYVTRTSWTGFDGSVYNPAGTVGDIQTTSSVGPSRDTNRTGHKPEVAAPGTYIGAALSSSAFGIGAGEKSQDGKHLFLFGTSMSSPHVAGVAALMLQKKGSLSPSDVRTYLTTTAVADGFVTGDGAVPNNTWGYGKVDALAAMQAIAELGPGVPTGLVQLTAAPSSLTANGSSTSTVVSSMVTDSGQSVIADGAKFNVEVTHGSGTVKALGAGDETYAATAEVEVTGGSISFVFRAGTTTGNAVVTVDSQAGDAAGTVTIPLTSTGSSGGGSSGGGGGCFIATAAYEGEYPAKLTTLRVFRYSILLRVPGGPTVVDCYYTWGPVAAEAIGDESAAKTGVRLLLEPLVTGVELAAFFSLL